jgi:hypothetical protein
MADERIDLLDHATGKTVPVPADVLRVVTQADQIVGAQLAPLRHLPLRFTSEHGFGRQVRVDELRQPAQAKEFVWGVLSEFAQTYSTKIGEQIQQIRTDLKHMLASGRD